MKLFLSHREYMAAPVWALPNRRSVTLREPGEGRGWLQPPWRKYTIGRKGPQRKPAYYYYRTKALPGSLIHAPAVASCSTRYKTVTDPSDSRSATIPSTGASCPIA